MKKFVLLFTMLFAFAASQAQLPDFWTGDTDIETFQETGTVHGGMSSCGVVVNSGTQANCDLTSTEVLEVSEGDDYKVSFWANTTEHVRVTCALDWVGAPGTYTQSYVGPATNGWAIFEFSDVVPTGATGVKLRIRFYDVAGFAAPETQYVDDLQFQSPVGAALTVANGDFESWPSIKPEPSEYPTAFAATPLGLNISLTWTDAAGAQAPDAYLILASTQNNFTAPVDGVFAIDDLDLTDGSGVSNVAFGAQTFSFTGLEGQMVYYFKIYSYTNAGTSINYKNDGTAPSAQAMTANVVVLESQNFDEGWGGWTTVSVVGDQVWDRDLTHGILGTPCAKMSGYAMANLPNEDWLISPAMNFDQYNNEVFTFYSACGYPTVPHQIMVKISDEYEGGDPNDANWTTLSPILPSGEPFWVYTYSGELLVSAMTGTNVRVAFVYISDDTGAETWEIENVVITGEAEVVVIPEPSNYPTAFEAVASGQSISLTWADATGTVIPAGYIVLGSTQNNITAPVDGTPVANDLDFGDGTYAVNIASGVEAANLGGLASEQTYYFKIFPYTNAGANIDFKTDGTAPSAEATTATSSYVDVLHTTFNPGWENWTGFSVLGDEVWTLDATHGVDLSQCAKMSGYAGAAHANEDWLVSPAINLADFANEKLSFFTAVGYTGDPLKVKISTNYTGSGSPASATWDDLSGQAIWPAGDPFWVWTNSGEINIAAWGNATVYVAFVFTSTDLASSTWEVDEIKIIGEGSFTPTPEPTNYPTLFAGTVVNQSILLSWVDAVGAVVPGGYLIKATTQTTLPNPVDGTPVADDMDFGDGFAAKNIGAGVQNFTFTGLAANTTYFFSIYPYTNSGDYIDYKTSATPPYLNLATSPSAVVEILNTTFNADWEGWTQKSITGDESWELDPIHGVEGTQCAKMSGFLGAAHTNEDWLISPAINMVNFINEKLSFSTAVGYTGPALSVLISTNYDGAGNPGDYSWADLSGSAIWPAGDPFWVWTNSGDISISAYGENTAYVAFRFTSTDAASATWEVDNVKVTGEDKVGIDENISQSKLFVYPNPSNGKINIATKEAYNQFEVYALTGQLLLTRQISSNQFQADLSDLTKGMYLIRLVNTESGSFISKNIIVN
jgi:hypothetical protein